MRKLLLATAAGLAVAACVASAQQDSWDVDSTATGPTQTVNVSGFDGIDVSAGIAVLYTQASSYSVEIESLDGGFDDIKVKVDDNELIIGRTKKWSTGKRDRYVVRVTSPELEEIDLSSGASFKTEGFESEDLEVSVSSGADAELGTLRGDDISIDVSSGSVVKVAGTCSELELEASSGASIKAGDLICAFVDADVSSGASITTGVTEELYADASSGGSVTAYGAPRVVETDKSSGGSVTVTTR